MGYESLNFSSYEDLTRGLDRDHEIDEQTLRAMVHTECKDLFDAMARHITRYVKERDDQKLQALFMMIQDGCNQSIDIIESMANTTDNV